MSRTTDLRESHTRSILKALTWRIVATGTTLAISYAVTGKTSVAFTIAGVESITKMVIYYLHERAWQSVARGTIRRLFGLPVPPAQEPHDARIVNGYPAGVS